jgi:hypothetical protein
LGSDPGLTPGGLTCVVISAHTVGDEEDSAG